MNADLEVLADAAVLVCGQDILEVGPAAELEARCPGAKRARLKDRVLMPGLVNAHHPTPRACSPAPPRSNMKLAPGMAVQEMLAAGLHVGLGTDGERKTTLSTCSRR